MKNPLREYGLFGWNYVYLISHPWVVLTESYYRMKWFIQRGYRGYSDRDIWSLDFYLASWMPAALLRLEKTKLGHPCGMTKKGWNTRLRIMREGFEAANEVQEALGLSEVKALERKMHKGLDMFNKHFLSLWD